MLFAFRGATLVRRSGRFSVYLGTYVSLKRVSRKALHTLQTLLRELSYSLASDC